MPSRLGSRSATTLYYKRQAVKKLAPATVPIELPGRGYEPDIRGLRAKWSSFRTVSGLIPVADRLQTDDGFLHVDRNDVAGGTLPLGDGALPSATPQAVVGGTEFTPSLSYGTAPILLAVTAYDGVNDGRLFYRANATADWTAAALGGGHTAPDNLFASDAARLYDVCIFQAGAPGRAVGIGGPISGPVAILCNGYDAPGGGAAAGGVMIVYGSTPAYAVLSDELSVGEDFRAATCCEYGERVLFGATRENDVPYPQRIRWTPVGDCSLLLPAHVGAGALDLVEFKKDVLAIRKIGDSVFVYAGDGVAQLTRTEVSTRPLARRYITNRRGLLAPRAVCSVGRNQHFGIFTDGWFLVTEGGEWTRVGMMPVDDGAEIVRWDETFYRVLNYAERSRLCVAYDQVRQGIRISFPSTGSSTPDQVWFLDLKSNTVWPGSFGGFAPTYWWDGKQIYASGAPTWATVTGTWATITGTWGSYSAPSEDKPAPIFGTAIGMVYQTSYASVLQGFRVVASTSNPIQGGVQPSWAIESQRIPLAKMNEVLCPEMLWLHYEDQGPCTIRLGYCDAEGTQDLESIDIGGIRAGTGQTTYSSHRFETTQASWYCSGTGAVRLRSLLAQIIATGAEQITPQA